jgi:hypothetical protein
MMLLLRKRSLVAPLFAVVLSSHLACQDPKPTKEPDKEVADKVAQLKEVVLDKKFARDEEGKEVIDVLLQKLQAGVHPKDEAAILKAFEGVLTQGKVRPADNAGLYVGVAAALGYCGPPGAKVLKAAYAGKRFPDHKDWVPLREQFLKNLGRTKDETMVKFLCDEARRSPEAALQAAAGEALGNFEESKEAIRKEIVSQLLIRYGELSELASQMGSSNIEAQNARDRLATLSDKWNTTLGKLTRQNFTTFREWQSWYNNNKGAAW